jgi:hypothetical protein
MTIHVRVWSGGRAIDGVLTTEHAASSYGVPVFVVKGQVREYPPHALWHSRRADGMLTAEEAEVIDRLPVPGHRIGISRAEIRHALGG